VALTGLSGSRGELKYFRVQIPAGKSRLEVSISGGLGDGDLYVKGVSKPTVSNFDCRPYRNGNSEICTIGVNPGVVYHVMIRAYANYSGLNLKAVY
jgi:hypothetical protein